MNRLITLMLMVTWVTAAVVSQDKGVAFFSKIKGNVKVIDAKGKETKATTSTKLNDGDKVVTDATSTATVTYYTGKEVSLAAKKSHVVKSKSEDNSFLSSLYGTLSGLIWGESSGSSMAGATRAWAGDANRMITATYPSETKILEMEPVFKWADHRKTPGKDYIVVIKSEISDFKYEIPVSGATQIAYPKAAPKLKEDEKYIWTVKDAKGADVSPDVRFSLIHPDDKSTLEDDLKEVLKVCNGDNTNPQWYLLTAALYRDYGLMKETEIAIQSLVQLKPDMAQAHIMLATLYKETGRLEEAKIEEETARKLSAGTK